MEDHKCMRCGDTFKAYKSKKRKYCSLACRAKKQVRFFTCKGCSSEFVIDDSIAIQREKRSEIKYCSRECYIGNIERSTKKCNKCGVEFKPRRKTSKFCSNRCRSQDRKGQMKTGFWFENGYKIIYTEDGKGIKEHRKIMEDYLGRELKEDEVVHHINGIKIDNRIDNLQVMSRSDHSSLHRQQDVDQGKNLFNRG